MEIAGPLFREHELAFRTQYAEVKERVRAEGPLLPGTPGTLTLRRGTGYGYWYRVYYGVPGRQSEEFVCAEADAEALTTMERRMAFAAWVSSQVSALRKLGFQVADRLAGRVLVELHNRRAFESGMVLVGTLAWMALMNESGAAAVSARTLDVDLAVRSVKLAAPMPFLESLRATTLAFAVVPGLDASEPPTSVKLPGAQGLRIDVLANGTRLGETRRIPALAWAAQTVPFYAYLLEDPEPGALLAGSHCIPVRLPQAARFVWHKLYSSTQRHGFPEKAEKDRRQGTVLAAALIESEPGSLEQALAAAPRRMRLAVAEVAKRLVSVTTGHPALHQCLTRAACR